MQLKPTDEPHLNGCGQVYLKHSVKGLMSPIVDVFVLATIGFVYFIFPPPNYLIEKYANLFL